MDPLKKETDGRTGIGLYPDGMVEHDDMVGELLKKLDELGSPTTPSSCTAPTTAPRKLPGRMAARLLSTAKRAQHGKEVSAYPA